MITSDQKKRTVHMHGKYWALGHRTADSLT